MGRADGVIAKSLCTTIAVCSPAYFIPARDGSILLCADDHIQFKCSLAPSVQGAQGAQEYGWIEVRPRRGFFLPESQLRLLKGFNYAQNQGYLVPRSFMNPPLGRYAPVHVRRDTVG